MRSAHFAPKPVGIRKKYGHLSEPEPDTQIRLQRSHIPLDLNSEIKAGSNARTHHADELLPTIHDPGKAHPRHQQVATIHNCGLSSVMSDHRLHEPAETSPPSAIRGPQEHSRQDPLAPSCGGPVFAHAQPPISLAWPNSPAGKSDPGPPPASPADTSSVSAGNLSSPRTPHRAEIHTAGSQLRHAAVAASGGGDPLGALSLRVAGLLRSGADGLLDPAQPVPCGGGLVLSAAEPFRVVLARGAASGSGGPRPGDVLVAVDGRAVAGRRREDVGAWLAGPAGSRVHLSLLSDRPDAGAGPGGGGDDSDGGDGGGGGGGGGQGGGASGGGGPANGVAMRLDVPPYCEFPGHVFRREESVVRRPAASSGPATASGSAAGCPDAAAAATVLTGTEPARRTKPPPSV
jgi:hypothetical protein